MPPVCKNFEYKTPNAQLADLAISGTENFISKQTSSAKSQDTYNYSTVRFSFNHIKIASSYILILV